MNLLKTKALTKAPGRILTIAKVMMLILCVAAWNAEASGQITPAFSHSGWGKTITFTDHTINHAAYYTVKTIFYGDGTSDTVFTASDTVSHTYAHYGTYQVTLKIYSTAFSTTFDTTEYVTLDTCKGSDFIIKNTARYSISLTATDTADINGNIYTFNTGNGDTTQGPRNNYTYSTDGTYHVCLTVRNPHTGCYVTNCKRITVSNGTVSGLEDISKTETSFQIYPNPVHDKLMLNYRSDAAISAIYTVRDMLGRTYMMNKIILGDQITQTYIDVEGLPAGIYMLKVDIQGKEIQSRFVKVQK